MKKYIKEDYLDVIKNKFGCSINGLDVEINKDPRNTIIISQCPKHGIQKQIWGTINRSNKYTLCDKCTVLGNNFINFLELLHSKDYEFLEGDYQGAKSRIKVQCKINKIPFYTTRNNILYNKNICPKRTQDKNNIIYFENFKTKANIIFSNYYSYEHSIYKGVMNKIDIQCPEHGIFSQTPDAHLRGQKCPKCSISYPENYIKNQLDECNIEYIYNKGHNKLINPKTGYPLKPDFYLPKYNLIIEYDGIHHFKEMFGNKKLEKVQEMDKLKEQLCKENNIGILRFNKESIYSVQQELKNLLDKTE